MPRKSIKTKKAVKVIKKMRTAPVSSVTTNNNDQKIVAIIKLLLIIALGVVIFLLVQKNRSMFIAGTVNKSPISRMELNTKMAEKYGEQTFEEIVSERLLAENLKKYKITVTDQEVQDELTKIKAQYGGEEQFQAAITQFGMTEEKAIQSIKQSIGLKKIIETQNKIEIKDEDISKYFTENKDSFTGKKLEDVSTEIKEILYQQEVYTLSQDWYSQVRKDASVSNFL